ncbi:MAG TPA: DUF2231 domain-containing protein [Gemmatimonadales bacterium]|nr:DUF2231 domain-containing protein [Gemmatimonadales bacterium]
MRSKASIRGHPIHPALIVFPFAFLSGALVFDIAGRLAGRPSWWTTGGHLAAAGVIMALVAAVPGFVDYFLTVPPQSSAKRRATLHMAANLSGVVLIAIAWFLRRNDAGGPGADVIILEAVGVILLSSGAWMGGKLVSRNQISVDHRYAGAGRWHEDTVREPDGTPIPVAMAGELQPDQMKLLHIGHQRIVLARTEKGFVAFEDHCTHRGGSLADGVLICDTVQCPWHGSQFDVRTGAPRSGPAGEGIHVYRVEERGGEVCLLL